MFGVLTTMTDLMFGVELCEMIEMAEKKDARYWNEQVGKIIGDKLHGVTVLNGELTYIIVKEELTPEEKERIERSLTVELIRCEYIMSPLSLPSIPHYFVRKTGRVV